MIDDPLWPPDRRIMAGAKKRTRQNVKDENQNRVMLHVVAVCSTLFFSYKNMLFFSEAQCSYFYSNLRLKLFLRCPIASTYRNVLLSCT